MDTFMQWLAANSLKGAILIIAVFLAQFVFSKQIPQKWKYLMWMLVAVRLLMPALFESESSIFNLQKIWRTEKPAPAIVLPEQVPVVETTLQQTTPVNVAVLEPEIELTTVIFYVWAAVAFLLFLYLLWKNFRLLALVRKEKTVIESRWLRLLEGCKRELKLYTPVQVIETRQVSTPALMGFVRPRILLPEGILETMNESEMKLVFMHELTHLKSGDIIINWIISLIQIIHWFNPLVWFAFAKAREARELACDDRMLSFLGKEESKRYGLTIIRLLDLCCNENRITGMVGILENKKQINRRIEMIRNPNPKTKTAVVFTLILLSFMGAVFLSEASENTKPAAEPKEEDNDTVLYKKLKSIIIPRFDFEDVTVKTVVRHLQEQSKKLDPDGVGVNIILTASDSALKKPFSLVMAKKKSLYDAIYFLCKLNGLKFRVERGVVVIADSTAPWKGATLPEEKSNTATAKKLKSIIFPNIEFSDAHIFSVIRFLNRLGKRADRDKVGVPVVADFDKGTTDKLPKISMKGSNMPMDAILRYLCKKTGLDYKIEQGAVILVSKNPALYTKLKSIIIPRLDFEKISVEKAVRLLREQSKKLDPDGVGVNIVLMSTSKKLIDLVLVKKSMYDAIYFICKASGLKFRVQKDIVLIADKSIEYDGFEIKTFQLKSGALAAAGLDDAKKTMKYFQDRGVTFPAGSKLHYTNQNTPFFIMTNTRENQDKIESIIQNELNKTKSSDFPEKANKNIVLDIPEKVFKAYLEAGRELTEKKESNPEDSGIFKKYGLTKEHMKNFGRAYLFYFMSKRNRQAKLPGYAGITPKTKALFDKYCPEIKKILKKTPKTEAAEVERPKKVVENSK